MRPCEYNKYHIGDNVRFKFNGGEYVGKILLEKSEWFDNYSFSNMGRDLIYGIEVNEGPEHCLPLGYDDVLDYVINKDDLEKNSVWVIQDDILWKVEENKSEFSIPLSAFLVTSHDNLVRVSGIINGKSVMGEAKCHPDDNFDMATGFAIAYQRMIKSANS